MPYPNVIPPDPPLLERVAEYQRYLYVNNALGAHAFGAAMSVGLGCTFGIARGIVLASMCPRAEMLSTFTAGVKLTAPLYTVPFFLASQMDAFVAIQARQTGGSQEQRTVWPYGPADMG